MKILKILPQIGGCLHGIAYLLMLSAAIWLALAFSRSQMAEEVYQNRLVALAEDYESLAQNYNRAVRRTAVTILDVSPHTVAVEILRADGKRERFPTPCNPQLEVYVDYALLGNQLLIRRIFDAETPPAQATVISPTIADIDWRSPEHAASYGKAVYRKLEPGKWVITISGSGALALERAVETTPTLATPPEISRFDIEESQRRQEIANIGWREIFNYWQQRM